MSVRTLVNILPFLVSDGKIDPFTIMSLFWLVSVKICIKNPSFIYNQFPGQQITQKGNTSLFRKKVQMPHSKVLMVFIN